MDQAKRVLVIDDGYNATKLITKALAKASGPSARAKNRKARRKAAAKNRKAKG
jgi:hypothetical protein